MSVVQQYPLIEAYWAVSYDDSVLIECRTECFRQIAVTMQITVVIECANIGVNNSNQSGITLNVLRN